MSRRNTSCAWGCWQGVGRGFSYRQILDCRTCKKAGYRQSRLTHCFRCLIHYFHILIHHFHRFDVQQQFAYAGGGILCPWCPTKRFEALTWFRASKFTNSLSHFTQYGWSSRSLRWACNPVPLVNGLSHCTQNGWSDLARQWVCSACVSLKLLPQLAQSTTMEGVCDGDHCRHGV